MLAHPAWVPSVEGAWGPVDLEREPFSFKEVAFSWHCQWVQLSLPHAWSFYPSSESPCPLTCRGKEGRKQGRLGS